MSCFYLLVMWRKRYTFRRQTPRTEHGDVFCGDRGVSLLHWDIIVTGYCMWRHGGEYEEYCFSGRNLRTFRESLLRPSSGNIFAPPQPPFVRLALAVPQLCLFVSVYLCRGFASWSRNLGKLLLDCMASHSRRLCSSGYQTIGRHMPPQNDA
jgi:hypothetical protein